ncbi:1-phosphatidylinositol 4,5-bisphosphate phosphodiesterase eta-2 isoform X3 [Falco rusticolus]|uniref:1-phosphatidylinositol 4,5-bisphosphate phosphodiesterase eta-2 isoform X3 n=1 Tax=Falco rusticolus TaxID=120794 RepID=UPI0018869794|nr:1-phosphatidylinositol 4,5-bisphosphate phosphodiesterase eta-2 isoform X3 [Falco rusticolus]XP_037237328.1 1-phosphatidylinositol 4,5-bisphosphate phosphodiesterase eta-2 isoform X3 [Falco rusticolus]XP_037237329.1 1-phosphatidylinositol 4,5-bisphosphate phosphodiesterase eta-2 isoform X3 [Falco rusticolus]XP_037237330.1 1-phosphatidylinositol 4,5-bisphosphate phosphodiesterase eta-2 isoform X3 [Falco rusticolus]XP_037237331.1 1-phosphatidylinositol 4,5-bisphosphate phosphodiesterase eta-2 
MALTSPKPVAGDLTQRKLMLHDGNGFHFLSANIITIVERCMSSMQTGTQMIKLRGSSKGLVRFYYLDEHKSCIRWRPSRKNEKAKISIDSIQEVCEGKQSEIFQRYADGSFDPNCCFSIYYGDHMESLDLVSSSGEEARTWITGLKYLMAGISDEDSLSKRQRTRDQWLKQTFDEADKNGDGSLSISEVLQLMHKLNVNLPRQKVKQMFKEADTDDNQGTLGFDEFCAFYKMMSTRRDLYLLMLTYSNHKDYLDTDDLRRFLEIEQKMTNVTKEHCLEIISKFEPCLENKKEGALGIDGFTNYMRSPSGDIFNPEHYQVNQDMSYPLSHYFITSSHNTYLMGDQLMSQSRVDMYAWVLQSGCRCVEVDCWDGPDGEPIVHHGYTLTSKILFKDVIETINKYAFIKNEYPVILSIENHCSVIQQKKMAQYLTEILGDKLDLSSVHNDDSTKLPSPASLKGKILVKGKKLPANISDDAEEGEVSDEDSADEIDDDCKLMNGDASANRKRVENIAKKKLDSLIKESKIRDCEDPNNFAVTALPSSGKAGLKSDSKKNKLEDDMESGEDFSTSKRHGRSLMGSFSKRKKKGSKLKKATSLEEGEDDLDSQGNLARSSVHCSRINRQKKTMKLSRALSDLVKYTKSVGIHDVETEISSSWQVSSFSETKAHQILQQKPAQYLRFNQHQLSRIYPSSYRVDSSNYNPQPFWNAGCQLVALNYQSEGRMLQLNRAKFSANGNCGYVLKPNCMCQGVFNPNSEDPLPGQLKKQLVLRIISGQQLPKPRDSMLGDRGEIIDPFVEVEVIGLPVDCFKEQTRVVDDNGFNPMWEETLVFTVHMPEIALIRFLVWDHDPIGRDFIGQRTIAFSSMMPGYRHVYLEGIEEASIFVHVAINDICGKAKQALGLKGLFLRNPKQASLDSHAAGQLHRKHSFSSHILRRTASAPTKSQKKNKKGFPEIAFDTKDNSCEGVGEACEVEDASQPRFEQEPESAGLSPAPRDGATGEVHGKGLKVDVCHFSIQRSVTSLCSLETITEEPVIANENHHASLFFPLPVTPYSDSEEGSVSDHSTESRSEASSTSNQPQESLLSREQRTNLAAEDQVQAVARADDTSLVVQEDERTSMAGCLEEENGWTQARGKAGDEYGLAGHPQRAWLEVAADKTAGQPVENCQKRSDRPGQVLPDTKSTIESKGPKPGTAGVLLQQNSGINSTQTTSPPDTFQKAQAAQAVPVSVSQTSSYMLVRRSKSEGLKVSDSSALIKIPSSLSPAAEIYFDATVNDRIWSKLDCSNHRDSMSSSSSMSSNDTVIDLSLPNLARKSLPDLGIRHENFEPLAIRKGMRPRSATTSSNEMPMVSKSKSNPNLRSGQLPADELCPRPLARSPQDAFSSIPRRHTWSRLYIESLRQSSNKSKAHDMVGNNQAKSKSLGDLTSDDIVCTFESKYRSISRSFVTRSMREQRRSPGLRSSVKSQDELTEQLKKLTAFQQENDITSPISLDPTESEEEGESLGLLRRSSSRSQSRVRYIANRAKQAQERQRLQSLGQLNGSPIEERGNPEGACSVAKAVCMDMASPAVFTSQPKNQTDYNTDTEVFFMLKL